MRYSLYALRDDFKKGKPLPSDVNQFVKDAMVKLGFGDAVELVERKEKCGHFGNLNMVDMDNPMVTLSVNFRWGMVAWIDRIEEILRYNRKIVTDSTRIKNPMLDTKPPKGEKAADAE